MQQIKKRISSGVRDSTLSTDSLRLSMSWSCSAYWGKYCSTTAKHSLLREQVQLLTEAVLSITVKNINNRASTKNNHGFICPLLGIIIIISLILTSFLLDKRMNWICQNNFLHCLFTSLQKNREKQTTFRKLIVLILTCLCTCNPLRKGFIWEEKVYSCVLFSVECVCDQ